MLHDLMLQTSQQGRAEEGGREGGRGRGSGADPGRVRPALPAAAAAVSRSIHDTHAANQSIEALIDTCLDRHTSSCGHLHHTVYTATFSANSSSHSIARRQSDALSTRA